MRQPAFLSSALIVLAVSVLASCATPTPYQASAYRGGFKEERIDDLTYRISFSGNGVTSGETVFNYWLYRCAEFTLSKGYTGFVFVTMQTPAKTSDAHDAIEAPGAAYQSAMASSEQDDSAAAYVPTKGSGGYIYVPSYSGATLTKYTATGLVHLLKDPVAPNMSFYRARPIITMLQPFVLAEGKTKAATREEVTRAAFVRQTAKNPDMLPSSASGTTMDDFKALLPGAK